MTLEAISKPERELLAKATLEAVLRHIEKTKKQNGGYYEADKTQNCAGAKKNDCERAGEKDKYVAQQDVPENERGSYNAGRSVQDMSSPWRGEPV